MDFKTRNLSKKSYVLRNLLIRALELSCAVFLALHDDPGLPFWMGAKCQVPGSQAPSQALMQNISLLAGSWVTLASHGSEARKDWVLYTTTPGVSNVLSLQLDFSKQPVVEVTGVCVSGVFS